MAVAAAVILYRHTAPLVSTPPRGSEINNGPLGGRCPRLFFTMPVRDRCAPPYTYALRVKARASPRKESAKVRNRRLQKKFNGTPNKPRLSVFCSTSQLYAMLIDDQNKKTMFYASTLQKSIRGNPACTTIGMPFIGLSWILAKEAAQRVGEELIKACTALNIFEIASYDRNGFARGERIEAFEIAIAEHGFLPR